MKRDKRYIPMLIGLYCILILVLADIVLPKKFVINTSGSVPYGLYMKKEPINLKLKDFVMIDVPENYKEIIKNRKWLKSHQKLIKIIFGTSGSVIQSKGNKVYINNKLFGSIASVDSNKMPMPIVAEKKYQLAHNQYFLGTKKENSLDSRYFGHVNKKNIICRLTPVFTWE